MAFEAVVQVKFTGVEGSDPVQLQEAVTDSILDETEETGLDLAVLSANVTDRDKEIGEVGAEISVSADALRLKFGEPEWQDNISQDGVQILLTDLFGRCFDDSETKFELEEIEML